MSDEITVYICKSKGAKHFLTLKGEWLEVSDCLTRYYKLDHWGTHTLVTKGTYQKPKKGLYFHL